MQETIENGFVVSLAKVGDVLLCGFCNAGVDIEGRGVTIFAGPVVVTLGKGKPVCRTCLKEKDPAFLESFLAMRRNEDREEKDLISREFNERYQRSGDLRKDVDQEKREFNRQQETFFEEARKGVLVHPQYLTARRMELSARQDIMPKLEAQAALAKSLVTAGEIAPKDRPKFEAKLSAAENDVAQARVKVSDAETRTSQVYAAIFQEITGQAA